MVILLFYFIFDSLNFFFLFLIILFLFSFFFFSSSLSKQNKIDEAIDTDLRQSIYEAVVQSGDQDEYETIRDMYVTTTDAIEHSRLV